MSWRGSGDRGNRVSSTRRGSVRPLRTRSGSVPSSGWRSGKGVRRASAGISRSRIGGVFGLVVALGGLYGITTADAFQLKRTDVSGAFWTTETQIRDALAVPSAQNVFELSTSALADRLAPITAIRSASIRVELPDRLVVAVVEREPLVTWSVGSHRYLVDSTGLLFAELGADADPAAVAALPAVDDGRSTDAAFATGSRIDAVTLDAALRLGSLKAADLGSGAALLAIRLDDADGFSITAAPVGWTAVFGFYTPTLRTTDLIPGQVRLLRSLLYGREAGVLRVVLADDRSGTYIPRPTASGKPAATPKPSVKP